MDPVGGGIPWLVCFAVMAMVFSGCLGQDPEPRPEIAATSEVFSQSSCEKFREVSNCRELRADGGAAIVIDGYRNDAGSDKAQRKSAGLTIWTTDRSLILRNFEISYYGRAIQLVSTSCDGCDIRLENGTIKGPWTNTMPTVQEIDEFTQDSAGLWFVPQLNQPVAWGSITVKNVTFQGIGPAVFLSDMDTLVLDDVRIDCAWTGLDVRGRHLFNARNVEVSGCEDVGLKAHGFSQTIVQDTWLYGNRVGLMAWGTDRSASIQVSNVTAIDNSEIGVDIYTGQAHVAQSRFGGNGAIEPTQPDCAGAGLCLKTFSATIRDSSFEGNHGQGIAVGWVDPVFTRIDGRENWWGHENGPSLSVFGSEISAPGQVHPQGDRVDHEVDVYPWLTSPPS